MNLGSTIKKARKERELTQHELASRCGITQTYLSLIESNKKDPNLSTLKSISNSLGLPLPILFYLSLEIGDIDVRKRASFSQIDSSVKSLVNELFEV